MAWLDEEAAELEAARQEKEWAWADSGYDYFGDRYQAALERYDTAVRNYNQQIRHPYCEGTKPNGDELST